jgi:hypothetical protein
MKKIKLLLSTALLCISFLPAVFAQDGPMALGFRATPDGGGFTGQFFLNRNFAFEAQLNGAGLYEGNSVTAVGLMECHIDLPVPNWRIFFGAGIHFGLWNHYYDYSNQGIFGIDGIGGVEYMFSRIPLGLSADFKPAVNFAPDVEFFPHNIVGASARYYFRHPHAHPPVHR